MTNDFLISDFGFQIIKKWKDVAKSNALTRIHPTSDVKSKQMDEESVVGDQTMISDKTSIKCSIMGAHCKIENKVRLTNCIIMNNVIVKEG